MPVAACKLTELVRSDWGGPISSKRSSEETPKFYLISRQILYFIYIPAASKSFFLGITRELYSEYVALIFC